MIVSPRRPAGIIRAVPALLLALASTVGASENRFADVEISRESLRGDVHMLVGAGGNIGVLANDAGMLMVDDQYAPLAERISAALDAIAPGGPRFVLNTHYHGDHTGGNDFFARTGTILAHANVRLRLLDDEQVAAAALPMITYDRSIRLHMGEETIDVVHLPHGHTDGDSVVFFRAANVAHLGDHFFNGRFPFIDLEAGGSVRGVLDNVASILAQIDDETIIIPGHGPVARRDDLQRYHDMISDSWARVQRGVAAGLGDAEIRAAGVDPRWAGWTWSFITTERWIDTLLREARGVRG